MSHYDCRNCGYTMGIDFGICERCTPSVYKELKSELHQAYTMEKTILQNMPYLQLIEIIQDSHIPEDYNIDKAISEIVERKVASLRRQLKDIEVQLNIG